MKNATTLYLVRHGQTEWNTQHRMQGRKDSPLTPLGVRQAEQLGEALRDVCFDIVCTSSSGRARHTAQLVRGHQVADIVVYDELQEIDMGHWEGLTQEEIKASEPERLEQFWKEPDLFEGRTGESFHDAKQRALACLNGIVDAYPGKTILIVTHSATLKLLMAHWEGRPMRDLWEPPFLQPASLCKVALRDGRPEIILYGDVRHDER